MLMFLALGVVFPSYSLYFFGGAVLLEVASKGFKERKRKACDRASMELLFKLGARESLTEKIVAEEMASLNCFKTYSTAFFRTSRLEFPNFGWRTFTAANAIKSALKTGDRSIVTRSLKMLSRREDAIKESQSLLMMQKYTLLASVIISSAVLGIASSVSGTTYTYYVVSQAFISSFWLMFLGGDFYESASLSIPLSLVSYLVAKSFL